MPSYWLLVLTRELPGQRALITSVITVPSSEPKTWHGVGSQQMLMGFVYMFLTTDWFVGQLRAEGLGWGGDPASCRLRVTIRKETGLQTTRGGIGGGCQPRLA